MVTVTIYSDSHHLFRSVPRRHRLNDSFPCAQRRMADHIRFPVGWAETGRFSDRTGDRMSLGLILLIVLVLVLVGALPTWPHSSGWGYGPTGGVGLLLVIVIVLLVMGVL